MKSRPEAPATPPPEFRFSTVCLGALALLVLAAGCASSRHDVIPGRPRYITPLPPRQAPVVVVAPAAVTPAAPAVNVLPPPVSTAAPPGTTSPRDGNVWRAAAAPWLGTPYRLGGYSREGIDCSAFASVLHEEVASRRLPRTTKEQWNTCRPVAANQWQPGDLLFFRTSGREVSHVGVFLGGNEFVHASTSRGVMHSSLTEVYWVQHFQGARRP